MSAAVSQFPRPRMQEIGAKIEAIEAYTDPVAYGGGTAYWELLLPHEQKQPSLWHPILRRRWREWHWRIFRLERDHGLHDKEAHDVLPWVYGYQHEMY